MNVVVLLCNAKSSQTKSFVRIHKLVHRYWCFVFPVAGEIEVPLVIAMKSHHGKIVLGGSWTMYNLFLQQVVRQGLSKKGRQNLILWVSYSSISPALIVSSIHIIRKINQTQPVCSFFSSSAVVTWKNVDKNYQPFICKIYMFNVDK